MTRFKTRDLLFCGLVVLLGIVTGGGCASFNRAWRDAATNPETAGDLRGRWEGIWHSDADGHSGRLRCLIVKTNPEDPSVYQARFQAKYRKVLTFGYTVPLRVQRTSNSFEFKGEANLGWLAGGVYHYDGHAEGTNFFSNYSSRYDHGTFQMTRP